MRTKQATAILAALMLTACVDYRKPHDKPDPEPPVTIYDVTPITRDTLNYKGEHILP